MNRPRRARTAPARPSRIRNWRTNHPGCSLASAIFFDACRGVFHLVFTILYRHRRLGLHHIPRTGPLLIVANHQSHFDPIAVGLLVAPRATHPIARIGLFKMRLFAWGIRSLNAIPIRLGEPDTAAIREALARLKSDAPVLIFPEGSRTFDGAVQPFQRGTLLLLRRAKCSVLPVAIEGAFDAWPRTRKYPRLFGHQIAIAAGPAIPADELLSLSSDDALKRLYEEVESLRQDCRSRLDGAKKL